MGLSSIPVQFSHLSVFNLAISMATIRDVLFSILEIVGIKLGHAEPPIERTNPVWGSSIEAEHDQGSGPCHLRRRFGDAIRDSLAVVTVDSVAQRFCCEEDKICAVCLCEYEKEDPIWLLPSCSHIFHKCCLNRWLDQNQTTCPTCRSSLVTQKLSQKRKEREESLTAEFTTELALWFSFYHGPAAMRSLLYESHVDLSE